MQGVPDDRRTTTSYPIFAPGLRTLTATVVALWQDFSPLPYGEAWDGAVGFYNPTVSRDRWFFGLAPACLYHLALMKLHLAYIFTE
jgi:hypothetical protein